MKYRVWILSLFPEYFSGFLSRGVVSQALSGDRGAQFEVNLINIRDYSPNQYKGVDDAPYGGGPGMVMRPDILKNALIQGVVTPGNYPQNFKEKLHVIYPSPRGISWNAKEASMFAHRYWGIGPLPEAAKHKDLVFICGRYEGIDERFIELYVDEQISLGDYVLTGGEIAVMSILDSALRFHPGVLGNKTSNASESFQEGLLEHPQYTRPAVFEDKKVPEVLISGHHEKIKAFQTREQESLTKHHRPDLWERYLQGKKK